MRRSLPPTADRGAEKRYDQAYFDRWYRDPETRVKSGPVLERKVQMVVSVAEYYLERPLRSVLDVGCGEGVFGDALKKLRPKCDYLGIDSSEYAIQRFGLARNLRLLDFGALAEQRFERSFDLLVCSDVMHYLPNKTLLAGLSGFDELCHGLGFFEVFCRGDAFVGDLDGFLYRNASWYRRVFAEAGWSALGSHFYLSPSLRGAATRLELAAPGEAT